MRQHSHLPDPNQTIVRALPAHKAYLIGVSGGRDSVALLHWLIRGGYRRLIVCHLNHQLRGRASDADARFVEKLAATYGLPWAVATRNVKMLAAKNKMSIESAARAARYDFFAQTARRRHCSTVLLAHHADDLVETFLINLFRGAGGAGLSGIREASRHTIGSTELQVIRPLLGAWRSDIDAYIREHRLSFRDDASNADLGPLRNRIRHRVIPYLEKHVGRDIRGNIWRTARIAADEEHYFSGLTSGANMDSGFLLLKPLREIEVALQRRTLHRWLRAADVADVGFDLVERVRQLLDPATGVARTNLPGDRHVRRRAGKLILE